MIANLHHFTVDRVRPAVDADLAGMQALMGPHLADGTLRPRDLDPQHFLVMGEGALAGMVGLASWTPEDLELGSLVSTRSGGGRRLVRSALNRARALGAKRVLCLTGVPGFFERMGFQAVGTGAPPHRQEAADAAVTWKAARCAACPDASTCSQTLMEVWL